MTFYLQRYGTEIRTVTSMERPDICCDSEDGVLGESVCTRVTTLIQQQGWELTRVEVGMEVT